MSEPGVGFDVKKPISAWNRPLKANFRSFFKSLSKTAVHAGTGQWERAATTAIDAATEVGLTAEPGQVAWMLLYESMTGAMAELAHEVRDRLRFVDEAPEAVVDALDFSFEDREIQIDAGFFEHPLDLDLHRHLEAPFHRWLVGGGLTDVEARGVVGRLGRYFVYRLHREFVSSRDRYAVLEQQLDSPFAGAARREQLWTAYSAWLDHQLDEPLFSEAFGLRQVYVPLRAYWNEVVKKKESEPRRGPGAEDTTTVHHVVDLAEALTAWVDAGARDDVIRVISGGPGSGKSSFCKTFSAQMAARPDLRVVWIPLHRFQPEDDLRSALQGFAKDDPLLPTDLLDAESKERFLLVFDGLDELASQGKLSHDIARRFVEEVRRTVERLNLRTLRLQVLLSGRELAIQTHQEGLGRGNRVLHLLGYAPIDPKLRGLEKGLTWLDPADPMDTDQRNDWWRAFGEHSGRGYEGFPEDLQREELDDITNEPLLNYLLALSYIRDELDFSEAPNLNEIYRDLLSAVYERGWGTKPHPGTEGLEEWQFIRILEEVALTAWHGDGRKTSVEAIQHQCSNSGLAGYLDAFEKGAEAGVLRLLTAFYFRQRGHGPSGARTFEFTHKSFGEYLAARRIVVALEKIDLRIRRRNQDPDDGIDARQALLEWAELCGPAPLDRDLFRLLKAEVESQGKEVCGRWQETVVDLINFLLRHGLPMTQVQGLSTYRSMKVHARNAEEALLACLHACAHRTQEASSIQWPNRGSAGEWLRSLQGQQLGGDSTLAIECLDFLDLSYQTLVHMNFRWANLRGAILKRATMDLATLQEADLSRATLTDAKLSMAHIGGANLGNAALEGANLESSNLGGAILGGANLEGANLNSANFIEAFLVGANLKGAKLEGAYLGEARFEGANLEGAVLAAADLYSTSLQNANLKDADLEGANLEDASLEGANLKGANLEGANLRWADLQSANLEGANLEGANLEGANLEGANLIGANLKEAKLQEADLEGANLQRANLRYTYLHRANLEDANLEGADLEGANLKGTVLEDA